MEVISVSAMDGILAGHSMICGGLFFSVLECLIAHSLLLHKGFKAQLLLIAHVKEYLVFGLVEDGVWV